VKSKIIPLEQLQRRIAEIRAAGKKLVATNGCFDILHVGHVRYLQAARALGDYLLVGVNGDASTRELKGAGRPINNENDRAEVLAALAAVDLVTIFPEVRATRFLELAQPSIYVKGGDYTVDSLNDSERKLLEQVGTEIRIIPFEKGYSTSSLLAKLTK
jgi:D-glycero-beta-D-manno-heptose 1-phosphate adenylyltransferase